MKKYFEIVRIYFKTQLVWRFEVGVNALFPLTKVLFAFILWGVIFQKNEVINGFTFNAMLSYYIISSLISAVDKSSEISENICTQVKVGTFTKYMVIPVNVQCYFLAQNLGITGFHTLFNVMAMIVGIIIFRVDFIVTAYPLEIVLAMIMMGLGLIFMIQLHFFIGILSFKFLEINFFRMIVDNLVAFIAGTLIPLSFLPKPVVSVMRFFPFYYTIYLPSMVLVGKNGEEAPVGVWILSLWVVMLFMINKTIYARMCRHFDGVGI